MNMSATQESPTRYFSNRETLGVWGAVVACFGVISVGASLAVHSFPVTASLLLGMVAVSGLGYWVLSKNCYFISPTKAGFKDAFRAREVQFEEIQSVTKKAGPRSSRLVFVCRHRTVTMPADPINEAWLSAVKAEVLKRGIPFSSTELGFTVKSE
jgi:hypothetical protein